MVAKCGVPARNADADADIIYPGTPFIYIFKSDESNFSVVHSIANASDRISERSTPLCGELPQVAATTDLYVNEFPAEWLQGSIFHKIQDIDQWLKGMETPFMWEKQSWYRLRKQDHFAGYFINLPLDDPEFHNQLVAIKGFSNDKYHLKRSINTTYFIWEH